jgi:hypothetical protein
LTRLALCIAHGIHRGIDRGFTRRVTPVLAALGLCAGAALLSTPALA